MTFKLIACDGAADRLFIKKILERNDIFDQSSDRYVPGLRKILNKMNLKEECVQRILKNDEIMFDWITKETYNVVLIKDGKDGPDKKILPKTYMTIWVSSRKGGDFHQGEDKLRFNYGIVTPEQNTCGLQRESDMKIKWINEGDLIVFNDAMRHSGVNYSNTSPKIILIMDIDVDEYQKWRKELTVVKNIKKYQKGQHL